MVQHMRGRGDHLRQLGKIGCPADVVETLLLFQPLRHRQNINGRIVFEQIDHCSKDGTVCLLIKILILQDIEHSDEGFLVQQDGAEHTLLNFNALRGQFLE